MVRKMLLLLAALLILPLMALGETNLGDMLELQIIDDAGLFTSSELSKMTETIARIERDHQVDMVVLTTYDVPRDYSESMWRVRNYADDYYDNGGYGMGPDNSGMLILLDMNNRVIWLSTGGVMMDYITDAREEDIIDRAYGALTAGRYGEALIAALNRVEYYMNRGRQQGSFRYDEATGQRLSGYYNTLTGGEVAIAALVSGIAAVAIYLSVHGSYNLSGSTYSYDLASNSDVVLTKDEEAFVRQYTQRRPRTTTTSKGGSRSSGGSGVHRSSGGSSHGGGGRRF